jgi:DNA-binding Lrp family transcriptional regulator
MSTKHTRNGSTSFIFANCKGQSIHTASQISHLPNVESVTPVTGRFDLVIKLRTNEPTKAFNTMERIRAIKSITSTQTALSFQNVTSSSTSSFTDSETPLAYTLLKVKGAFQNVLRRLKTFPNFAEAHVIPGEFDIVAAFKGYSPEELLETSVAKIGTINGITASETLIAYTPPSTNF